MSDIAFAFPGIYRALLFLLLFKEIYVIVRLIHLLNHTICEII